MNVYTSNGMEWNGIMEWNGMEWNHGMEWNGIMEWNGMAWNVTELDLHNLHGLDK